MATIAAKKTATRKSSTPPKKPYPGFPLFAHQRGCWAKKIRGQHHYFGPWDDPEAAESKYLEQRDDLYDGRKPREAATDGISLRDLCNLLLNAKAQLVESGDLSAWHFQDLRRTCEWHLKSAAPGG